MSGISILMYHQVGRFPRMATHRATYCDVERFRAQMRMLRALGVTVMSMTRAVAVLQGWAPMPQRAVVLSFDDGYENFHEHALPVLEEFGFPSIVYAIAGSLGRPAGWLAADGHAPARLMSAARLREIASRGVEIGSHGMAHVPLPELDRAAQLAELRDSRDSLGQLLGQPVSHVCYPYGAHDLSTLEAAAEAGYASGVTCQRGAATPHFDPLALPRKAIAQGDNVVGFLWKLYAKDAPKGQALARRGKPDAHSPG